MLFYNLQDHTEQYSMDIIQKFRWHKIIYICASVIFSQGFSLYNTVKHELYTSEHLKYTCSVHAD